MFTASEGLHTFCFTFFIVFHNLFSQGHRFTHITCTGNICNHSLKSGCHFSTLDINVHFRILFIAKFEFLKLHSKVRSFERMSEFNQVRLGPIINILYNLLLYIFVGLMPYNFICVHAGLVISSLKSTADLFEISTIIKLIALSVVVVVPGLLLKALKRSKPQTNQSKHN